MKANIILKYGVIISVPMIILSIVAYAFSIESSRLYGWFSIAVFALTVFYVQKLYVENIDEKINGYSKLLGNTVLLLFVASASMLVYTIVFYNFIAPEQIERIITLAENDLYQRGFSDREIDQSLVFIKKLNSPMGLAIMAFFSTLIQGFIISLFTSYFNKKQSDKFEETMKNIEDDSENNENK